MVGVSRPWQGGCIHPLYQASSPPGMTQEAWKIRNSCQECTLATVSVPHCFGTPYLYPCKFYLVWKVSLFPDSLSLWTNELEKGTAEDDLCLFAWVCHRGWAADPSHFQDYQSIHWSLAVRAVSIQNNSEKDESCGMTLFRRKLIAWEKSCSWQNNAQPATMH